jgi:hypothetical protein
MKVKWNFVGTASSKQSIVCCLFHDGFLLVSLRPWRWRQHVPPKCRLPFTRLRAVMFQKKEFFNSVLLSSSFTYRFEGHSIRQRHIIVERYRKTLSGKHWYKRIKLIRCSVTVRLLKTRAAKGFLYKTKLSPECWWVILWRCINCWSYSVLITLKKDEYIKVKEKLSLFLTN